MKYDMKVNQSAMNELEYLAFEFLQSMGEAIKEEAKIQVPVDTGALQQDINVVYSTPEEVAVGSVNLRYARYVEEGTSKMDPQPYMRPALDKVVNDVNTGGGF